MSKKRRVVDPPTCNCLILCDDVLETKLRPKHILQGVIGMVVVPAFPATIGGFMAYVRLSNVYDHQKISLTIERADTGEEIISTVIPLPEQADPLGVYTLVVQTPAFAVQEAGRYMFNAVHDGVPIAQSPIMVVEANPRADQ